MRPTSEALGFPRRPALAAAVAACVAPRASRANHPLTIACYPVASSAVPLFAQRSGLFARAGLDVEIDLLAMDTPPEAVFLSGRHDILCGVDIFTGAPLAEDRRVNARYIVFHGYGEHHLFDALVARVPGTVRSLRDLAGKRLLIGNRVLDGRLVHRLLDRAGLADSAPVSPRPAPLDAFAELLAAGEAEAALVIEPWGTTLEHHHGFPIVQRGLLAKYVFDSEEELAYFGGVMTTMNLVVSHRPALRALAGAWAEAYDILREDPEQRREIMRRIFPALRIAPHVGLAHVIPTSRIGAQDVRLLQELLDVGLRIGIVPRRVDATRILALV